MQSSAILKNSFILFATIVMLVFLTGETRAQVSSVDNSFNPLIGKPVATEPSFVLQPDGKVLIYGDFQILNGTLKNQIARLNADGSLDNSFNCVICDLNISSVLIQPDGKILVAGSKFLSATNTSSIVIYRLNADGSLDPTFNYSRTSTSSQASFSVSIRDIQSDGKILIVAGVNFFNQFSTSISRLNADGTDDSTFTPFSFGGTTSSYVSIGKVKALSDGKILFITNSGSGGFSAGQLRRLNSNGTVDSTFEPPSITESSNRGRISDFDLLSDGSLIVVGKFTSVNGINRINIAKIQPAGNLDTNFVSASVFGEGLLETYATSIKVLSGNRFYVTTVNAAPVDYVFPKIYRFNADGSLDNTFQSPANLQSFQYTVDAAERIFLFGTFLENQILVKKFARLDVNGNVESSFPLPNLAAAGAVFSLAAQANGKVIVAGDFSQIGNLARTKIARLNSDGSPDISFDPGTGFDVIPDKIVIQSDGKVLAIGGFTTYNGTARQFIVRINSDGTIDNSFNPSVNGRINAVAPDASGRIIIGGVFSSINGTARTGLARLNSDGTLDAAFNPVIGGSVQTIFVQTDGKITIGGTFTGVNGFNRMNLVRLNSDGTLDSAFNAGNIVGVSLVKQTSDGKYFVVATNLLRLNNNGTTDATFQSPNLSNATINSIFAAADGSVIIGGNFRTVNNFVRPNLARLKPDGSLDRLFIQNSTNGIVYDIAAQTDGKILIGGSFTQVDNSLKLGAARLNVFAVRNITPNDFDGDGRADVVVFRPSTGYWYILQSSDNVFRAVLFGQSGDLIAPADYDNDGRTDIAVWRGVVPNAGNFAYFYILNSSDNSFRPVQFGATGDVPVVGDWDGDGKADLAVYREGAQSNFYYRPSSISGANFTTIQWGSTGDKPLVADFDGDNKIDAAIFQPSTAKWYILQSSNGALLQTTFGATTDIPVPADYDGDGKANIAVFRPSNGYWYTSTNPAVNYGAVQFGVNGDLPVPSDFDGDGKTDVAVFRPSNGAWYLNRSTSGFTGVAFGAAEDKPIPNSYIR